MKTEMAQDLAVGIDLLTDFWNKKYLDEYIMAGGSKMKFVTGRPGSGKSFFLRYMIEQAKDKNYITAFFSAKEIWLNDFKEIYIEILKQINIMECLKGCASKVIASMGIDESEIPDGMTFMDYLSEQGMGDAITRREIRLLLKKMFLEDPLLDNNFAIACSLITGGILGHPLLEKKNQELLLSWLLGERDVKLSLLRSLGLSPSRITKYNARHMLRSLGRIINLAGYSGLIVGIDDLEILLNRSGMEPIHYTKLKREDTYESIRQLIDEIDSMKNLMFIFAFDRELLDNDNSGIKSYQALWMRIQSEIVSQKFNCFADIVDMDALGQQIYTEQALIQMAEKMQNAEKEERTAHNFDEEDARNILSQTKLCGVGIPGMVYRTVMGGTEHV